jgi:hypothetical protein
MQRSSLISEFHLTFARKISAAFQLRFLSSRMPFAFLFCCGTCLYHRTPTNRIAVSHSVTGFFSETFCLPRGEIILLTLDSPHSVLSIAAPHSTIAYIGLSHGAQFDWFQLPDRNPGFYAFGSYTAIVEIVATRTTTVAYTVHSIGSDGCASVRPACSGTFSLPEFAHIPECFATTTGSAQASITGDLGSGELTVHGGTAFNISNPLALSGFTAIHFLNEGPIGSTAGVAFRGGHSEFEYAEVNRETEPGVVGVHGLAPFTAMLREPDYPLLVGSEIAAIWVVSALVLVTVPIIAVRVMTPYFVKTDKNDAPQPPFFDSQADLPQNAESESATHTAEAAASEAPEIPDSPYEGDGAVL